MNTYQVYLSQLTGYKVVGDMGLSLSLEVVLVQFWRHHK